MAALAPMIKTTALALASLVFAAVPVSAQSFTAQRGINLDQWVTWPSHDAWVDEDVLFPFPEWRRHVGHDELALLAAAGFDFVRIPVDPSPFLAASSHRHVERLHREVLEAVRLANRAGLKAIVDLHLIQRSDAAPSMPEVLGDRSAWRPYRQLVRDMAAMLSGEDPAIVAFELMNEPEIVCEGAGIAEWTAALAELHRAARQGSASLTLVLTGGCGGSYEGLVALDPSRIDDPNVIWTFHNYWPFLITHQGAQWSGDLTRYLSGLPFPPHSVSPEEWQRRIDAVRQRIAAEAPVHRRSGMIAYVEEQLALIDTKEKLAAYMRQPFEAVAAWADRHGIAPGAVLLGEFGMIRQEYQNPYVVPPATRASYYTTMIVLAEEYGFPWALWSYGGAFGVVEEFERRPAEPEVMGMIADLAAR